MALLSFEHVSKHYSQGRRDIVVLDDVSFEIDSGDFIGIWGMRRSGKSTLLRVAAGIEPPDQGKVLFDGMDITRMSAAKRARLLRGAIGLASMDRRFARNQRVVDHVALPLVSDGVSFRQATLAARRALDRVGARDCADAFASWLSPGEQVRVGIARTLIHEPGLLLIDEPALTPNPAERDELYKLLRALPSQLDTTLVIASEDTSALRGAKRMMSIADGQLHSTDRAGQLVKFPERRAVAAERPRR
ncbi:MAG TPA: ATP-binding cassette domain-containing protein [Solirubrobacteraceae bacterium]|nr:ATP-binding cassette domain-containing protein [Solirubrobacteraceae bacterium]